MRRIAVRGVWIPCSHTESSGPKTDGGRKFGYHVVGDSIFMQKNHFIFGEKTLTAVYKGGVCEKRYCFSHHDGRWRDDYSHRPAGGLTDSVGNSQTPPSISLNEKW